MDPKKDYVISKLAELRQRHAGEDDLEENLPLMIALSAHCDHPEWAVCSVYVQSVINEPVAEEEAPADRPARTFDWSAYDADTRYAMTCMARVAPDTATLQDMLDKGLKSTDPVDAEELVRMLRVVDGSVQIEMTKRPSNRPHQTTLEVCVTGPRVKYDLCLFVMDTSGSMTHPLPGQVLPRSHHIDRDLPLVLQHLPQNMRVGQIAYDASASRSGLYQVSDGIDLIAQALKEHRDGHTHGCTDIYGAFHAAFSWVGELEAQNVLIVAMSDGQHNCAESLMKHGSHKNNMGKSICTLRDSCSCHIIGVGMGAESSNMADYVHVPVFAESGVELGPSLDRAVTYALHTVATDMSIELTGSQHSPAVINAYNAIPYMHMCELNAVDPNEMRVLCGNPLRLYELNTHQLQGVLALLEGDHDTARKNGVIVSNSRILYQDLRGALYKITGPCETAKHTYVHRHGIVSGVPLFFDLNSGPETPITCTVNAPGGLVSRNMEADVASAQEPDDVEQRARRLWRAEYHVTIEVADPLGDGFSRAIATAVNKEDREELLQLRAAAHEANTCTQVGDTAGAAIHTNRACHYRSIGAQQSGAQRRTSGR